MQMETDSPVGDVLLTGLLTLLSQARSPVAALGQGHPVGEASLPTGQWLHCLFRNKWVAVLWHSSCILQGVSECPGSGWERDPGPQGLSL